MNYEKYIIIFSLASAVLSSAQAANISNEGEHAPSGDIIAQNVKQTTAGRRPVSWNNSTTHSLVGQSFTALQTATAGGISLQLDVAADFSRYHATSFIMKVFKGNDRSATLLGTYVFDATGLGGGAAGDWIRFELGAGLALTSGTVYSFLLVNGSENRAHVTNFKRTKAPADYAGGEELRAGNAYDIANWESDPWDVVPGATQSAVGPENADLLFSIDAIAVDVNSEPETLGLLTMVDPGQPRAIPARPRSSRPSAAPVHQEPVLFAT